MRWWLGGGRLALSALLVVLLSVSSSRSFFATAFSTTRVDPTPSARPWPADKAFLDLLVGGPADRDVSLKAFLAWTRPRRSVLLALETLEDFSELAREHSSKEDADLKRSLVSREGVVRGLGLAALKRTFPSGRVEILSSSTAEGNFQYDALNDRVVSELDDSSSGIEISTVAHGDRAAFLAERALLRGRLAKWFDAPVSEGPHVFVGLLKGARTVAQQNEMIQLVSSLIAERDDEAHATLFRVVRLDANQAQHERRRLQDPTKGGSQKPFQGSDYVIMFWTVVSLIFILAFVFLCIPWAPPLDPLLRSTFKKDSGNAKNQ